MLVAISGGGIPSFATEVNGEVMTDSLRRARPRTIRRLASALIPMAELGRVPLNRRAIRSEYSNNVEAVGMLTSNVPDDLALQIRQARFAAGVAIGQFLVVEP